MLDSFQPDPVKTIEKWRASLRFLDEMALVLCLFWVMKSFDTSF